MRGRQRWIKPKNHMDLFIRIPRMAVGKEDAYRGIYVRN
jgi:hypothetical protein